MRKRFVKLFVVVLAIVMATTPLTAMAAWDRLENSEPSAFKASSTYPFATFQQKITEAKAVNSDVIGWLKVPSTNIDVPIILNKTSNDDYMYRDWKGTYYSGITWQNYVDTATCLDFRTKFGDNWRSGTSKNMVLYGHNWNNLREPFVIGNQPGYTMFAQLPSYTNINFAKQNPHIYFSTGENEGIWRVFAVSYCELSANFTYNYPNPSTEQFQTILDEWSARTLLKFDVDVDTSDRILTLSTCTRRYGNFDEGGAGNLQRYVVVARLLRDGESESDTVNVTANPNWKQPSF